MAQSMWGSEKMESGLAGGSRIEQTGANMKATEKKTTLVAKAGCSTPMEIFTKETGKTTKLMASGSTSTLTEHATSATGKQTSSMDRDSKPGPMGHSMKVNIRTGRRTALEH